MAPVLCKGFPASKTAMLLSMIRMGNHLFMRFLFAQMKSIPEHARVLS